MLLAIDVGNSQSVLGVYEGDRLISQRRIDSHLPKTVDEIWRTVRSFRDELGLDDRAFTGVGISSVIPDLTGVFEGIARDYLKLEPVMVGAHLDLGMRILYANPASVGADRLCNAVAGYARYGGPLIIIDFGTATTYDVVTRDGEYLGGAIALGLESTAAELHRRTARLPKIELRFPEGAVGRDTTSGMQSGVMYGAVDAVEGMIRRIRLELGAPARVIATGGLASLIAPHVPAIDAVEPALVLDGIRLIWEKNRPD
jgi:type III pantothenate kinase